MKKTRNLTNEEFEKVKEHELYIMNEIHKICVEHDINYSLFYGSLLGAVRHKGFIPWDDDIDIIMSLEDYWKFKSACDNSLPENLYLQDYINEPDSCLPYISKIRLNGTQLVELPNKNKTMHHGVWVDIFVYKTFSGDKNILNQGRKIYNVYKNRVNAAQFAAKSFKGKIASLLFIVRHPFSPKFYKKKMYEKYSKIKSGSKIILANFEPQVSSINSTILKNLKLCSFEQYSFYCVQEYDLVLHSLYGEYMKLPKEEDRIPNHSFVDIKL